MKNILFKLVLVLFIATCVVSSQAQVSVTMNITPPYSTKLSDYATLPGKVIITLNATSTGPITGAPRVFLKMTLTGDNGIKIATKDNFKPAQPIVLQPNIPMMVDIQTLNTLFDVNSFSLTNITSREIFDRNGLPEGNYQICVRAYNFDNPSQPMSAAAPNGCTFIRIAMLEPPMLIKPFDKEEIKSDYVQSINFSWNISPGAEPGTQYLLRIIEMIDPNKNPNDAMNSKTVPPFFETTTVANVFMYGPGQPAMVNGRKYAWAVTALSGPRGVAYRNNGRSEVRSFVFTQSLLVINNVRLTVINPNDKVPSISVNRENDFLITWNWLKNNATNQTITDTTYKQYGVHSYDVEILAAKAIGNRVVDKIFTYKTKFARVKDELSHKLVKTVEQADAMGLKNNYWYTVNITAKDVGGKTIQTTSQDFQYKKIADVEPVYTTNIQAQLKYAFQGKPEIYNASTTPVEVQAFRKSNGIPIPGKPKTYIDGVPYTLLVSAAIETDGSGNLNVDVKIPASKLPTDSVYFRIKMNGAYYLYEHFGVQGAKAVKKDTSLSLGQFIARTYGYSLKLNVKKAFPSYLVKDNGDNLDITVDTSNKAYKEFTYSGDKGGMTYQSNQAKPQPGITIVLYRKSKKNYVPPVEGNLLADNKKLGYVEVGRAKTQIQIDDKGKEEAIVEFKNLLANLFAGDEYYALALNNANNQNMSQSGSINGGNFQINTDALNGNPYVNNNYSENDFIATEMAIKVPKPVNIAKLDSLYRSIKYNYNIISKQPPTSLVKGKLLYKWSSEGNNAILRPVSKQSFKVVIDYLVNGQSIGDVSQFTSSSSQMGYSEKFFVLDGQDEFSNGQQLLDNGQTMGIGSTDAEGNFELTVVNFNKKGSLGVGHVVEKGWTANNPNPMTQTGSTNPTDIKDGIANPVINPWDGTYYSNQGTFNSMPGGYNGYQQTGGYNAASQGFQNSGFGTSFNFNTNTGFFDIGAGSGMNLGGNINLGGMIGGAAHGPSINAKTINGTDPDNPLVTVERVYRIVPTNKFLYPTTQSFVAASFEAKNVGTLKSNVTETSIKITTQNKDKKKLEGMMVTIFRPIGQRYATMPMGEGDGNYTQKELINPQYKGTNQTSTFDGAMSSINNNNLFATKFEILSPVGKTKADGTITIPHLLIGGGYYIMACSNPDDGEKFYKASFTQKVNSPEMTLEPLPSRIFVRAMDNDTQEPLKEAYVYVGNKTGVMVDNDGYLELKGWQLPIANSNNVISSSLFATRKGYKTSLTFPFTLNKEGAQFRQNLPLMPSALVKGHLISKDENSKAIRAFVKASNGNVVETDNNGYFSINVPSTGTDSIKIIPKDVAYFDSTVKINYKYDLKDIGLYRRKHRIMVNVVDETTGNSINGAKIKLGDEEKTTAYGLTFFEFENVSVNNYTFVVRGPNSSNYVPLTMNIKNDETKGFVMVKIKLEKGSEVSGTVTLDGKAVSNAKVYLDLNSQTLNNDANLLVAKTNSQGKYVLNGVPVNNKTVNIIATLDTSFTVNGDNKPAIIKDNKAVTNLTLAAYNGMAITNIYGFPLTVEKITTTNNADEVKVTGTINWTDAISDFKWIQGNDVLRVEDVVFKSKTVNGKKIGEVQASSVDLEGMSSIKLRYLNKYNVKLFKTQDFYWPGSPINPLSISKDNDYGVIAGKINIVDNSFNYPSTYINFTKKDQFYLCTLNGQTVNTVVKAVSSAVTVSQSINFGYTSVTDFANNIHVQISGSAGSNKIYNISNAQGKNIDFKFIKFNATADATKSYIAQNGKIHLNVNMQCHVANAQPEDFSVNVADVTLDDNNVYAASSNTPLELKMEKWTLLIKNWKLDPKQGGITSANGLIKTSKIDIPFNTFNLRSDMFVMDDYQFNEVKIGGGIKQLSNVNASNAALVFDNKTGSDMKPHWRFSMSSTGNPVAKLTDLPDVKGDIGIGYIQLLSNDENVFQLTPALFPIKLYDNSFAKFTPQSIANGPDFFNITGGFNTDAPRIGDMMLTLKFAKTSGALKMEVGNVQMDFEGKGFVHFTAKNNTSQPNIIIKSNLITVDGTVAEKPIKSFNPIPAKFNITTVNSTTATYQVDLEKNHVMQLTSTSDNPTNGYKLTLSDGYMKVVNKDWDILTYSGNMESNTAGTDKGIKPMFVTFKVLGDVSVDGDGAKMDGVNTAFGKLTMTFDFPNKKLMGTLKMDHVALGTNVVTGTVETVFEPKGFYVAGGGTAEVNIGNPIADGTYNLGFMVGSYPVASPNDNIWKVVTAYKQAEVKNDCYVAKMAGKLKGFYMTIDRIVLDKSADFDFVIVSGYVKAKAIIGADLYANFSDNMAMGVAVQVYAHGAAGMSAITGTSMNGSAAAKAGIVMEYAGNKFNLNGKIDVSFTASITQSLLFTSISASKSVGASATVGTGGFSLDLNSGNKINPCY